MAPKKKSKLTEVLKTIRSTVVLFLGAILGVSALIYLVWQINEVNVTARAIEAQDKTISDLKLQIERGRREIKQLSDYSRVSKIAQEEFALKPSVKAPSKILVRESAYNKKLVEINNKQTNE